MSRKNNKVKHDIPNSETIKAMEESIRLMNDPNTECYSVEDAIKEMESWVK